MSTNKLTAIASEGATGWAEMHATKYARAFNMITHLESATEELPVDTTHMPGPWSITYGGDENIDSSLYSSLVTAALNCVMHKGQYLTITIESALGERVAFDCTVLTQTAVQGKPWSDSDSPHVMVYAWYPLTDSVGIEPIKIYLHQIINIHFP